MFFAQLACGILVDSWTQPIMLWLITKAHCNQVVRWVDLLTNQKVQHAWYERSSLVSYARTRYLSFFIQNSDSLQSYLKGDFLLVLFALLVELEGFKLEGKKYGYCLLVQRAHENLSLSLALPQLVMHHFWILYGMFSDDLYVHCETFLSFHIIYVLQQTDFGCNCTHPKWYRTIQNMNTVLIFTFDALIRDMKGNLTRLIMRGEDVYWKEHRGKQLKRKDQSKNVVIFTTGTYCTFSFLIASKHISSPRGPFTSADPMSCRTVN